MVLERCAVCRRTSAIILAGLAAGTTSTLAQIVLWIAFTDAFPSILYRDARLAAALALGPGVLQEAMTFDPVIFAVATGMHLALAVIYAAVMCLLTSRLTVPRAVVAGGVLGSILYVLNLYGFTWVFPWFAVARDWITWAAHLIFGLTAVLACRIGDRAPPAETPKLM